MQDAARFWNKTADKYARSPVADMDSYERTLDRTRGYLSPSDRILEVGCGTGTTALHLAPGVAAFTGSDISENMIGIATDKAQAAGAKNVRFVAAGVGDPALGPGPYDVVLAFNLLHLLEDAGAAVNWVHGLLKPGGLFISKTVCRPGAGAPFKFRLIKLALPLLQLAGKAPFVRFMEVEELDRLVASEGFEILETGAFPAAPPCRFLVARKS